MKTLHKIRAPLAVSLLLAGCATNPSHPANTAELIGAWRSKVQFATGPFASVKDLEFLYVFNAGGTMTESSNYDGAPPVPPAYGVWKGTEARQFEAIYVFHSTKAPGKWEDITGGGGWLPAGRGVLTEKITVDADGKHFKSRIRLDAFDPAGNRIEGGEATGAGERIGF